MNVKKWFYQIMKKLKNPGHPSKQFILSGGLKRIVTKKLEEKEKEKEKEKKREKK